MDVTLKLEIRGKLTFGSDPVVDTIEINVAEMFVDTGVKVASDLELKGETEQQWWLTLAARKTSSTCEGWGSRMCMKMREEY